MTVLDTPGYEEQLFEGLATLLAGAAVGEFSPSGAYATGAIAITDKILPASPDSAIALAQYVVADDPTLSDSVIGLQVRTRAAGEDSRLVDRLAGAVFNQLHGLADFDIADGIRIVFAERRSGTTATRDELRRWSRIDNYYLTLWRPSPHRI